MSELQHEAHELQKAIRDDRITIGRLTQLLEARSGAEAPADRQNAINDRLERSMRYMADRIHRLEDALNILVSPQTAQQNAEWQATLAQAREMMKLKGLLPAEDKKLKASAE